MSLIARTRIKEIVGDFNIADEFFPAFEKEVEAMVERAMMRAKANQRRTLMARDV